MSLAVQILKLDKVVYCGTWVWYNTKAGPCKLGHIFGRLEIQDISYIFLLNILLN